MSNKEELWLPVTGFEGFYEVSNLGNVRSLGRLANHSKPGYKRVVYGKLLKPQVAKRGGYIVITLKKDRIEKCLKVHRLVAMAWLNNPNDYSEVNHKNGIKSDNTVNNLEWCTRKQNAVHAKENGLLPKYIDNGKEKPVLAFDKSGKFIGRFRSRREAGRQLNVCCQNISTILNGRGRYVKGYTFKAA